MWNQIDLYYLNNKEESNINFITIPLKTLVELEKGRIEDFKKQFDLKNVNKFFFGKKGSGIQRFTALLFACNYGCENAVIHYLVDTLWCDLTQTTRGRKTALHLICCHNTPNVEQIQFLLRKGVNLKTKTSTKLTALHCLCMSKGVNKPLLEYLVNEKQDHLNEPDHKKNLPIHLYCRNSFSLSLECLKWFILSGAQIEFQNSSQNTGLHFICSNQMVDAAILKYLLCHPNNYDFQSPNRSNNTPFDLLFRNKALTIPLINVCQSYLQNEQLMQTYLVSSLFSQVKKQNLNFQIIKFLVDFKKISLHQIPKNYNFNYSPFDSLCQNRSLNPSFFYWMMNSVDKNFNTSTSIDLIQPIHLLCENKSIGFNEIQFLAKQSIKQFHLVDSKGRNCLHYICSRENADFKIIQYLIELSPSLLAQKDNYDRSPFFLFCLHNSLQRSTIICFLNQGADPTEKDCKNRNVLNLIFQNESNLINYELLLSLFTKTVIKKLCTVEKSTFLYSYLNNYSIEQINYDLRIFQFFIKIGININQLFIQNNSLKSILQIFIEKFRNDFTKEILKKILPIIEYLIEAGTNLKRIPENVCRCKIISNLISNYNSFDQDFQHFFENKEFADIEIHGIKVHKEIVELRLKKPISEIKKILQNHLLKDVIIILKWVYGFNIDADINQDIEKIFLKLDIIQPKNRKLKKEIQQLYLQEAKKDFCIITSDTKIKVHKIILLVRSGLFRGMFSFVQDQITEVHDYSKRSPETMKKLIYFLYNDKLLNHHFNQQFYEEILDSINYYQLNTNSNLTYYIEKIKLFSEN
ncbi:ankyrin repeat-containing protein [Anaeramoeba flamelloides]|uniref:Ankyrin repeat-containing protein n=1 Tax=Anaeramoeba flamelloides TaxID=1746091 RepID=A0ABQ8YFF3_9EUKA|nr:ankyrin repeat-containing protein [Anaeramoeba flamelloides]